MDELHKELRVLGQAEAFGGFHPPSEDKDLGAIPSIKDASPTVKELAPQWLHLLQCVCSDDMASPNESAVQPATLILATMCHLMRPKSAPTFKQHSASISIKVEQAGESSIRCVGLE